VGLPVDLAKLPDVTRDHEYALRGEPSVAAFMVGARQ